MIPALLLAAAVAADTGDTWFGRDKLKHFMLSAFVHSVAFSATRLVADRRAAQLVAGGAVVISGTLKEVLDRRAGRRFSAADIAWDVAGGVAAASLMNGSR